MDSQNRYHRQIILPHWGVQGQTILATRSILVVGAGGLGCPLLAVLSGVGFKKIGIADGDLVSLHNLHRQTLFSESHVGKMKAHAAKEMLSLRNSETQFVSVEAFLGPDNAELIQEYDVIVDATDRFTSRYFLADAARFYGKILVHGAIYKNEGQVSTFVAGGVGYRDLFPQPPTKELAPDCATAGVSPALCSLVASMMADEVIHAAMDRPKLVGRLLVINAEYFQMQVFDCSNLFHKDAPNASILKSEEYVDFCNSTPSENKTHMIQEVSVQDLKQMQERKENFTLIDVREKEEVEVSNIGGIFIPLSEFQNRWHEVPKEGNVIVYCRGGVRSANAIRYLQEVHGYSNLKNLKGGILAWASEVDPTLTVY